LKNQLEDFKKDFIDIQATAEENFQILTNRI
jgi:hypothetical protein